MTDTTDNVIKRFDRLNVGIKYATGVAYGLAVLLREVGEGQRVQLL